MRTRIQYLIAILATTSALYAAPSTAASDTIVYIQGPTRVAHGQSFTTSVLMDSPVAINAMSGRIQYSQELLEIQSIRYQTSLFTLWPQTPNHSPQINQVNFTGGLPTPGFTGKNGRILEINFKARAVGEASLQLLPSSRILLNDGQGSDAQWSSQPYKVQIYKSESEPDRITPSPDTTPPINLELIIGRDSHLYEGNWFAVFHAEDPDSGIRYYEIAETDSTQAFPFDTEWVKANSPYRLLKPNQHTKVFLRAVDNSGNMSVTSREHKPSTILFAKTDWRFLIILALLVVISLILPIFVYHRKKLESTVQK